MEHTKGKFRGHKSLSLYYQRWLPLGELKAVLVIVHGLAEHSGRYTNLASYFAPRGYAVYAHDLRGHGQSDGLRGYVDRFSDYIEDLKVFLRMVRDNHANAKLFLVGHSMGGAIATTYAVTYQHGLAGLILSGATLQIGSSVSRLQIIMARILSALSPKTGISVIDASAISKDPAVVEAYVNDPLVYRGKIRARLGAELLATIADRIPPLMHEIKLPVLIMHATVDRLSNPEGSRLLYGLVGSKDKTLRLYEGLYHEIFNEPEREQVLADMEAWLAARCSSLS